MTDRRLPYRRLFRLRFLGRNLDREVEDELEAHIALRADRLVAEGRSPDEARSEAIRRLGGMAEARRRVRASARKRDAALRRTGLWEGVARDLTLSWRRARRTPGYTVLIVLSLALGIGLTTAVFTVMDSVLRRPLPLTRPDELVALWSVSERGSEFSAVSTDNWLDWRDRSTSLRATGFHRDARLAVSRRGERARLVPGQEVGGDFFRALESPVIAGRAFDEGDAQARRTVAVVSEEFWRTALGADRNLPIEITIDGNTSLVVGVLAEGTGYPEGTSVWVPVAWVRRGGAARNLINWEAIARLAPGRSIEAADAELDHIADDIRREAPEGIYSWGVGVRPLKDVVVGDTSQPLRLLLAIVGFVLLITCANVSGLSVARILVRSEDLAVCVAMGASRREVVRQVLMEHIFLGVLGGGLGVVLAVAGTRGMLSGSAWLIPRAGSVSVNGTVLAFAAMLSVLAGVLAAVPPALKAVSMSALAGVVRGVRSVGRHSRSIALLVVAEVALALVLLTSGGLLVRSYRALVGRALGYDPEGVLTVEAILNGPRYSGPDHEGGRLRYWESLAERLRSDPGVTTVGMGNWIPTGSGGRGFVEVPGSPDLGAGAGYRVVSDEYFQALAVPVLEGRVFGPTDDLGTTRVTVVNDVMARRYWPGESALGRTVKASSMEGYLPGGAPTLTVIGVVGSVRHFGYDSEPREEMFTLYRQVPFWTHSMTVIARTAPAAIGRIEARAVEIAAELDPQIPVAVSTLEQRLGEQVRARRFLMGLLAGFGALALTLAGVGVYGMLSFSVAQRTREIGLRAALGATRANLLGLICAWAARVVVLGAGLGLAATWVLSRVLQSSLLEDVLVDVAPTDPVSYGVAATVLLLGAALATFGPARRAIRVDPQRALRTE